MKSKKTERMVEDNLGLVSYTLSIMNVQDTIKDNPHLSYDDLYQEGCIGLCKAAEGFDETKGTFSSFAVKCIRNEVLGYLRKETCGTKGELRRTSLSLDEPDQLGRTQLEYMPAAESGDSLIYSELKTEIIDLAKGLGRGYEEAARALIMSKEAGLPLSAVCDKYHLIYKNVSKKVSAIKKSLTKSSALLYT